ncbi:hypothetical protein [Terriglobus aquaticus]|uniref:Zinc-finger of transposase IS204/IS1001/IS1096/IS1165 n=1 Tax=Terriglobus aquaticus TaxID=940139 RepID=A0ABW9KH06_9BACT|nr:hypothetical protein [Terriglobus aquaticus]
MTPDIDRPLAADPLLPSVQENAGTSYDGGATDSDQKLPDGVIGCVFCANTKFRRSRVRIHDVGELLLLRYPMRCMRCNQRQYGYFVTAAYALPPRSHNTRVDRGQDTWKAWTESERDRQTMQRPMTTSIGTRATKLQPPPRPTRKPSQTGQDWKSDHRDIW